MPDPAPIMPVQCTAHAHAHDTSWDWCSLCELRKSSRVQSLLSGVRLLSQQPSAQTKKIRRPEVHGRMKKSTQIDYGVHVHGLKGVGGVKGSITTSR